MATSSIALLDLWDTVDRSRRTFAYLRYRYTLHPRGWRRGSYPRFMQSVWYLRTVSVLSFLVGLLWLVVGLSIVLQG
jgi:hypothetical protein